MSLLSVWNGRELCVLTRTSQLDAKVRQEGAIVGPVPIEIEIPEVGPGPFRITNMYTIGVVLPSDTKTLYVLAPNAYLWRIRSSCESAAKADI